SDNGMNMGHHGIYGKGNGTFPPNMFDTSVKVPTILSQPGSVAEGEVITSLHSHYDLMPTLLDYVGVENGEAETLPGHSFAGILRGESVDPADAVVVYDEYGPTRMIRTATWKYIHRYPYGPHELYDLANDPNERQNLIDDSSHQTQREKLLAELEAWFVRYVDPARDGTHEAVVGRGQLNVVGPAAQGKQRFGADIVYAGESTANEP
ncbi:MAG: DUF4976 domain-containing protein, partial [Caldilineaceae bacterium]|nr:DUF4976 domain-containing protein [Caldilineaceae bacterium]